MAAYYVQKAFRDAMTYPMGPVAIELPVNILGQITGDEGNLRGCPPSGIVAIPSQPAGDPQIVEKAVRMLVKAKRPIIVAGDGIFWSKASRN